MESRFKIGDKVKNSGYVINKKRDYWNSCGREPMKSGARTALDEAIAARGVITAILPAKESYISPGIEVKWDCGSVSRCLDYLVSKIEK